MQATQRGTAPVSTPGAPGASAPSAIPKPHRYSSSRSNSISSASIVTVKRTASLGSSSGTGSRNSNAPGRAQSPGETSLITLRVGREPLSQEYQRRRSTAVETTNRPESDPLGNSQRYSHSTTSSTASAGNTKRNRASSGALIGGVASQGVSPRKRSTGTIDYSPRTSLHKTSTSLSSSRSQNSPADSPERERRRPSRPELTNPLNSLPSLQTTPALTDPNDNESPSTIQTIATPSTQTTYDSKYFWHSGDSPYNTSKGANQVMIGNHTISDPAMDVLQSQAIGGAQEAPTSSSQLEQRNATLNGTSSGVERDDLQNGSSKSAHAKENGRHSKRTRERGEKDKKSLLNKALQKANTAVLLDNAQNYEGAVEAYADACKLLQQVTERSSGVEDQRKLNAIKYTYTTRIEELRQMELAQAENSHEKSLPARPMSDDSYTTSVGLASPSIDSTMSDAAIRGTAISADVSQPERASNNFVSSPLRTVFDAPRGDFEDAEPLGRTIQASERKPDLWSGPMSQTATAEANVVDDDGIVRGFGQGEAAEASPTKLSIVPVSPTEKERYMPAPLSPTKKASLQKKDDPEQPLPDEPIWLFDVGEPMSQEQDKPIVPAAWLDTIEEDTSSRASSVHSMSSDLGLRRRYLRGESGISSNPDFDAAFDAAVEAAYDQGLEPDMEGGRRREGTRAKHDTKESIAVRSSEIDEITSPNAQFRFLGEDFAPAQDEEEERMMDEITQDYVQTFNFDVSSKSALPRQSGSSGYSRSTWQSSQVSDRTTAGTSLSTVAEDAILSPGSKNAFATSPSVASPLTEPPSQPPPPPPLKGPPPQTSLPKLPATNQNRLSGVRNRRLSGPNMKQLKIETPGKVDPRQRASTVQSSSPVKEDVEEPKEESEHFDFATSLRPLAAAHAQLEDSLKSPASLEPRSASGSAPSEGSRPVTATASEQSRALSDESGELRMHQPSFMQKSKSSDGLREHMLLLASPTVEAAPYLVTPLSSTFMNFSSKRMNDTPLTSQRANLPSFAGTASSNSYSEVFLFNTSLSGPQAPSSPRSPGLPTGVEPCPESFLLRPFWLMRNLAATLTQPRGGFLTSRLFVPREVWQAKSMKLKYLEEKIANCDMLTAALGRLAGIDTFDADATMEELESFEDVLERVQNVLSKRLGSDVGTSGMPSMFKDASASAAPGSNNSLAPEAAAGSEKVKGYLTGWRKLRSKSSGASTSGPAPGRNLGKALEKDSLNMSSVPMTSYVAIERRGNKKDVRKMVFEGPNKEYMSSLARLFEGVQVLDQIARQVEDPGLKGTSQTHVGLELSIRHAAEFFSFYVCRFVLADLSILMDKFLKKGTEWVLT